MAGECMTANPTKASNGRSIRINANATPGRVLGCRHWAKGQTRRPGAYRMVLQGSGRGEEATKKLLANGPVSSTNSRRPQGMRRNSPATKVRRVHARKLISHAKAASTTHQCFVCRIRSFVSCRHPCLAALRAAARRVRGAASEHSA
jgi:hypothetical protein